MARRATQSADIGLIGLAVMGQNLVLNMADHGFLVAVYNRTSSTMESFVAEHRDTPGGLLGYRSLRGLVGALKRPHLSSALNSNDWACQDTCSTSCSLGRGLERLSIRCTPKRLHVVPVLGSKHLDDPSTCG